MKSLMKFKKLVALMLVAAFVSSAALLSASSAEAGNKGKKALAIGIGALIVGKMIEHELEKRDAEEDFDEDEEVVENEEQQNNTDEGEEDNQEF